MKTKLLAVSVMALALTGCGHSAKSHFDKTYRLTENQAFFETMTGAAIKLGLNVYPTGADIILDDKGVISASENSYAFTGEWSSDDKGEGLFDKKGQIMFYFFEKGNEFCFQYPDDKVPLCYSEVQTQE